MKQIEQHIAWIDHFMGDESSPEEKTMFEEQVQNDAALAADFELMNNITHALSDQKVLSLQDTLQKIEQENTVEFISNPKKHIATIQSVETKKARKWTLLFSSSNRFSVSAPQFLAAASLIILLFAFLLKSNLFYENKFLQQENVLADSSNYQNNPNYSTVKRHNHTIPHQTNPSSTIKIKEQHGVLDNTPQLMAIETWLEKRCC